MANTLNNNGERDTRPGALRRRRLIERETPQPGFFGWLFLLIFLAFNAFMVLFLVIYWNLLAGMPPTTTGRILGTGAILFFWVSGAVITGLLVLLSGSRKRQIVIEEDIER
jgi:polyferredoxin